MRMRLGIKESACWIKRTTDQNVMSSLGELPSSKEVRGLQDV